MNIIHGSVGLILSTSSAIRVPLSVEIASALAWGLAVSVYYSAHKDNSYQAHVVLITTIVSCLFTWVLFEDTRDVATAGLAWGISAGLLGAAVLHMFFKRAEKETEDCKAQARNFPSEGKGDEEIKQNKLACECFPTVYHSIVAVCRITHISAEAAETHHPRTFNGTNNLKQLRTCQQTAITTGATNALLTVTEVALEGG